MERSSISVLYRQSCHRKRERAHYAETTSKLNSPVKFAFLNWIFQSPALLPVGQFRFSIQPARQTLRRARKIYERARNNPRKFTRSTASLVLFTHEDSRTLLPATVEVGFLFAMNSARQRKNKLIRHFLVSSLESLCRFSLAICKNKVAHETFSRTFYTNLYVDHDQLLYLEKNLMALTNRIRVHLPGRMSSPRTFEYI